MPRFTVWLLSIGVIVLGTEIVSGQNFPNRPIRILAGGAESGGDLAGRLIAQGLIGSVGQPVIVENRPSSAAEYVAKASPDGYTLLHYGNVIWIAPLLRTTPWDPVKDFAPIMLTVTAPNLLVVTASLPVKSVEALIAFAKASPGKLNYASSGPGSSSHIAMELFKAMAGVSIVHVPYKSGSALVAALISGEVQMSIGNGGTVAPNIKSGQLRALAVTSAQPSALMPELPTVAASGLPGYESDTSYGMYTPFKTPQQIIIRLNQEILRVLSTAGAKDRLSKFGLEPVASPPDQLAAKMKSEMARLGKVIKEAGIKTDE